MAATSPIHRQTSRQHAANNAAHRAWWAPRRRGADRRRPTRRQARHGVGEAPHAVEGGGARVLAFPPAATDPGGGGEWPADHAARQSHRRAGDGRPGRHQPGADGQAAGARRGAGRRHLIVIGDRRVLEDGAQDREVALDVEVVDADAPLPQSPARPFSSTSATSTPPPSGAARSPAPAACSPRRTPLRLGARQGRRGRRSGLHAVQQGRHELAVPAYDDEISFVADAIGFTGEAREFNVMEGLWNARVTCHVPLAACPACSPCRCIVKGLELTHAASPLPASRRRASRWPRSTRMPATAATSAARRSTSSRPAVARGEGQGLTCDGPFPSDTVFLRARRGHSTRC